MTVHFLDCATLRPYLPRWHVGTPCILFETGRGLALVDTGLGLHDYTVPSRMVRFFMKQWRIPMDPDRAAMRQIMRLGYAPEDVQDIIMTHLHFDHAGGLPDFPHAIVHLHHNEHKAMQLRRGLLACAYDLADFSLEPRWELYENITDDWLGFEAIRLPFEREIFLIPLFGHTPGHCGVAIHTESGWLLQCADALPTNAQFDLTPDWLNRLAIGPHVPRLRTFAATHHNVQIMAGHMWESFFSSDKG